MFSFDLYHRCRSSRLRLASLHSTLLRHAHPPIPPRWGFYAQRTQSTFHCHPSSTHSLRGWFTLDRCASPSSSISVSPCTTPLDINRRPQGSKVQSSNVTSRFHSHLFGALAAHNLPAPHRFLDLDCYTSCYPYDHVSVLAHSCSGLGFLPPGLLPTTYLYWARSFVPPS